MQFHSSVLGANVQLDDDNLTANRKDKLSFCNGVVFSSTHLIPNTPVSLTIKSIDLEWRGSFSVGLLVRDPVEYFKDNAIPKILQPLEGVMRVKTTPPSWANCRIILMVTFTRDLIVFIDDGPPQIFFNKLHAEDDRFWLALDVFGRTNCISFTNFDESRSQIPMDIALLGPQTIVAYKTACKEASVPYNQGRVFFIGPYGAGKTSLKRSLLGLSPEPEENAEEAINVKHMISSDKAGEWTLTSDERSDNAQNLALAVAYNMTRLIEMKSEELDGNVTCAPADLMKTALRLSNRKGGENANDPTAILSSLSDKLSEEVKRSLAEENKDLLDEGASRSNSVLKCKYRFWDYSGDTLYFLMHQVLMSSYAIYVLVIDITEDLEAPIASSRDHVIQAETRKNDVTTLNVIHFWLSVIYAHVGQRHCLVDLDAEISEEKEKDLSKLITSSPKVLIVGTHRNSVHVEPITRDQVIAEVFDKIQKSLEDKPYKDLVHPRTLAVDTSQMSYDEPAICAQIRQIIDQTFQEQNLLGFDVPLGWQSFEHVVTKLLSRGIYFVELSQLYEVARSQCESLAAGDAFRAALRFYHTQGKIYLLGRNFHENTNFYEEIVVLDPIWFVNRLYELCDSVRQEGDENIDCRHGMLRDEVVKKVWAKWLDHKLILLGCLEKLDFLCELRPYLGGVDDPPDVAASAMQPRIYFFPWLTQLLPEAYGFGAQGDPPPDSALRLAVDFNGLLPIGLFSRLVVRLGRWSWGQGWGRRPEICHGEARLGVDFDHDLILKIRLASNRIDVIIIKIYESMQSEESTSAGPTSNICVKVRHLLESELEFIRNCYYNRINATLVVPCPCNYACKDHQEEGCDQPSCEHFLPLEKCLCNKVVECDFRQVKTSFVQRFFPQAHFYNVGSNAMRSFDTFPEIASGTIFDLVNGWEQIFRVEPTWMREAAKMLALSSPGRDWSALSKRLGYSDRDATKLIDETNPSLGLLRDWYESNGRTRYCIDVLLSCLRMISRDDVRCVIESDLEPEGCAPPIFISYQWDSQETVLELRRRLELAGFPCWMDVGLMGGGDSLYGKIYDGISRAKVVICCLSPRYAASRTCAREITLADVLHKPILPIMIEPTPWPPPGPLAIVMSSLVYVDLCGVGGHGGIGKRGDSDSRFRDILDRISRYISGFVDAPIMSRQLLLPDIFNVQRTSPAATPQSREGASITLPARSDSPSPNDDNQTANGQPSGASQEARDDGLAFGPEDVMSEDSISVLSHIHSPNNRISNCSICVLL